MGLVMFRAGSGTWVAGKIHGNSGEHQRLRKNGNRFAVMWWKPTRTFHRLIYRRSHNACYGITVIFIIYDIRKFPIKKTVIFSKNIRSSCRQHLKRGRCHNIRVANQRQRLLCRKSNLHVMKNQRRHAAHKPVHRRGSRNQQERSACNITEITAKVINRTGTYGNNDIRFFIICHCNTSQRVFIRRQIALIRTFQNMWGETNIRLSKRFLRPAPCNFIGMGVWNQVGSFVP